MSLQFQLLAAAPASASVDCIAVGLFADKTLSPAAQALDAASGGRLAALAERGDLSGKTGRTLLLQDLPGVASPRVLVVGLGERAKFGVPQYLKAVADSVRALRTGPSRSLLLTLHELPVNGRSAAWALRQAVVAADQAAYEYTATRSKPREGQLATVLLSCDAAMQPELDRGVAIAAGVEVARELGNLPPNICNPGYLASQAVEFASQHDAVECDVLERAEMEALGMGSLLAVARGSANPPKLVVLRYAGGGDAKPYALVGKGITFDTGGVNLKTQGGIEEMKYDMLGAGETVFDRAWRLPLWDEYQTQLESTFADVYNIGGRWAGAITAGCFLARFTEGQRWAHLDIAGVSNDEGKRGMATGRPVGLLSQWLLDRSSEK